MPHKLTELQQMLNSLHVGVETLIGLDRVGFDGPPPDESGVTFAQNARIKAVYYATRIDKPLPLR